MMQFANGVSYWELKSFKGKEVAVIGVKDDTMLHGFINDDRCFRVVFVEGGKCYAIGTNAVYQGLKSGLHSKVQDAVSEMLNMKKGGK